MDKSALNKKIKLNKIKPGQVYKFICPYKADKKPTIWIKDNPAFRSDIVQILKLHDEVMVLEVKRVNSHLMLYVALLGEDKIGWMFFRIDSCDKWKKIV